MGSINRPYFQHFVFEIVCSFDDANSINWLENKTDLFLEALGIRKLKTVYHQFQPQGISLVHILSASHIAVHSWPEKSYVQFDLISCQADIDLDKLTSAVDKVFAGFDHRVKRLEY